MTINVGAYKLFFKYLFSYLLILFVPLAILGFFINGYFIGVIKEDVMANNMNKLERIRYSIDDHIKQIRVISDQLYIKNLTPFKFEDDPLVSLNAIHDLMNYKLTNNFISDILLYNHGDQYIYSSTSSYKISFMLQYIYRYEHWDEAAFTTEINHVVTPVVRPVENVGLLDTGKVQRFATFIYPISSNGVPPTQTLLFLISENAFHDLLKDAMKDYSGNTIVMDNRNRIITALDDDPLIQDTGFQDLLSLSTDTLSRTVTVDNVRYIFSSVVSPNTGWKYITIVPVQRIMEKITSLKLILLYVLAFIFVISCGVIYYLMVVNYKPIYRLKKLTESIWKEGPTNQNELTTVRHAFEYLNDQNTELYARLEDYSAAAKEYLLFQLIKGKYHSSEALQQKAQSLGLSLSKTWFRIIILHMGEMQNDHSAAVDSILELIEYSLPEDMEGYARDHTDQKNIVLVISYDECPEGRLTAVLSAVQANLKRQFGLVSTIGVGGAYREVSEIPKSYIESMTAIDYRFVKGKGQIIFSSEFSSTRLKPYPSSQFASEEFKAYIKQGDLEQVNQILLKMIHYFREDQPSMFEAKMISFEIINTVVLTIEEMNRQQPGVQLDYPDVFLLSEYGTVDELVETVKQLSQDINTQLQKMKEYHRASLAEQMIDFLHAHYTACDFTIQQMAEHFQMSQASLSQYFKEHTGSTILDFETDLKLDKAKQLLASSQLPIKDLALEVGYYNVNSFIRRFKQVVGKTPGEYRKLYQTKPVYENGINIPVSSL